MRISIITVCRNAAEEIGPTLKSVACQRYSEVTQVVVDGASTDDTLKVVERLAAPGAIVVSEPDSGIYDAMNKGLSLATGDLICFLNAGDTLVDSDVLSDVIDFFLANSSTDVVYGGLRVIDVDGATHDFMPPPAELALEELVRGCLPHQATFARPSVFERTQGFNLSYRIHADHDWFVKIAFDEHIKLARIQRTIATFKLGGTSSLLENSQPEFYKIQNSAAGYQTDKWLRRRVEILQQSLLDAKLKGEEQNRKLRLLSEDKRRMNITAAASGETPRRTINAAWDQKLASVRDRRSS